jgi:quercetin dioxygenase-like cupin family protein
MSSNQSKVITATEIGRWSGVTEHPYKTTDTDLFQGIRRFPLLNEAGSEHPIATRYFEIEADGYSSLEWHTHPHTVIPIRGSGSVIIGNRYQAIHPHDVIYVAPDTLHQFLADRSEPLGFLCVVPSERDRPRYPSADEIKQMIPDPDVRAHIRP